MNQRLNYTKQRQNSKGDGISNKNSADHCVAVDCHQNDSTEQELLFKR